MQWTDEGIVLGVKRHGETSVILELMTQEHGRHLGLVRGGAGTRLRGVLQPGNSLRATWRARLDEHLGHYAVEAVNLRAAGFLPARARRAWRDPSCRACAACSPSASRMRAIYAALEDDPRSSRRSAGRRADDRALRARFSGRAWFRPRSDVLRRDRHDRRSHLCVAAVGPRGVARRPAKPIATSCCGCRPFLHGERRPPIGRPISPTRSR